MSLRGAFAAGADSIAPSPGRGDPSLKLSRDVSGRDLAAKLSRYGYGITRQTGSHIRLTSRLRSSEHHITIPDHEALRVGTLAGVLQSVAAYLEKSRAELMQELFG
ncbi:MAG: type II toxin-antitoxin system HicA family toxin [Terriglobales bacterium]